MDLNPTILEIASRIRFLIMDCDGVMTDGRLYYSDDGEAFKAFHVHDGQGIVSWHRAGFRSAVITARRSGILETRAAELGISLVIQGADEKGAAVMRVCDEAGISLSETAYVGDDIGDVAPMGLVGLPVAVANAVPEARSAAMVLTSKNGGEGAIREVVEMLLSARNK